MTVSEQPWTSAAPEAANRQLVQVPLAVLDALGSNDLEAARSLLSSPELTPYIASDECGGVWRRRAAQIRDRPGDAAWVTRLVVDARTGVLVGRAGFHGPPDERGMVEVGYSVDPLHRRRGHARAALRVMLDVAAGDARVRVVRASVRPGNLASMGVLGRYGFEVVGEQWDDEDGLEKVLEVAV
ncbi:acetyltransferase gnat family protein [Cordyceps javanica]|uniref:Acetyltransferase gnat family protein n=1 Tax=Cordyceps javanica TaxID=43265 RepID=A0A545VSC5_9HYPO|nr:acetyltransferase gnat family protein [Cordyceps javanica]TQW04565.1 acetyltransferase gnat family protein [Cordyceps javanica]